MTEIPESFHAAKYLNAVVPHQGVTEMATQWHACQVHSQIKILKKIHKAVIKITAQTSPISRYEIEFPYTKRKLLLTTLLTAPTNKKLLGQPRYVHCICVGRLSYNHKWGN